MPSTPFPDWSFFEHVVFLARSWLLLVLATLMFGGGAFVAGRFLTGRTTAEALVRIGSPPSTGPIEKPEQVAARIGSFAFLESLAELDPTAFPEGTEGISLSGQAIEKTNLVRVQVAAPSVALAKAAARLTGERLAREHDAPHARIQALVTTRIAGVDHDIAGTLETLARESTATDPTVRGFWEARHERLWDHLAKLRNQKFELELRNDPHLAAPTALIEGPSARSGNSALKAGALGMMSGLLIGAFLAYVLEFVRRQSATQAAPVVGTTPSMSGN